MFKVYDHFKKLQKDLRFLDISCFFWQEIAKLNMQTLHRIKARVSNSQV